MILNKTSMFFYIFRISIIRTRNSFKDIHGLFWTITIFRLRIYTQPAGIKFNEFEQPTAATVQIWIADSNPSLTFNFKLVVEPAGGSSAT